MDIKIKDMDFPRSTNVKTWEQYLGRKLKKKELELLSDMESELSMNKMLKKLHNITNKKGLYVPYLTKPYGNCMFESLVYHKLMSDEDSLRNVVCLLMLKFADYKNFFPNQKESLRDIFNLSNEITHVYCPNDECFYKYTYETMCCDIVCDYSWTRLPTQLILMVISFLFKVNIKIIDSSTAYEFEVNLYENTDEQDKIKIIYMGNFDELHYVPLITENNKYDVTQLYYHEEELLFYKWAVREWQQKKIDTDIQNSINDTTNMLSIN